MACMVYIYTYIHVYILIRCPYWQLIIYVYWYLLSDVFVISHRITPLCAAFTDQRKRRVCGEIGCVAFFSGRLFRYPTQKALPYWANCTDYLISPSSNFFIIITRTVFFYFNLHRDIRATDPSWTFIRGKKITSQEIKYGHNSFNRVGLYLENFLSLPICSK